MRTRIELGTVALLAALWALPSWSAAVSGQGTWETTLQPRYFDGDATFQYALRVQIPGEFKSAPARAERMYQPTVQTNTSNASTKILDKK